MPVHRCEAIVLRRTRFSESSLIIVLFSREFGRIEALAKGCRRAKSPMHGHLDLFAVEDVLVYERSRGGLDLVTEAFMIEEFASLRRSAPCFVAACVLAEVMLASCMTRDPHPRAFSVLRQGLRQMRNSHDVARVTLVTLMGILGALGFSPRLDFCAECGDKLPADAFVRLAGIKGGLLCRSCAKKFGGLALNQCCVSALRYLAQADIDTAYRLQLPGKDAASLMKNMLGYTEQILGKGLRSRMLFDNVLTRESTVDEKAHGVYGV